MSDVWKMMYASLHLRATSFVTGASVGILVGLSGSPILGVLITSAFGLATILIQGWQDRARAASTTWHIPVGLLPWLPLGVVVGALTGIWMRANDSLSFHKDIRHQYRAMGFSKFQVERIVDAAAIDFLGNHRNIPDQLRVMGFSDDQIATIMKRLSETTDIIEALKSKGPAPTRTSDLAAHAPPGKPAPSGLHSIPSPTGMAKPDPASSTQLYTGQSSGWFAELKTKFEDWKTLSDDQLDDDVRTTRALVREVRSLSAATTLEGEKLLDSYDKFLTLLLDKKDKTMLERWEELVHERTNLNLEIEEFFKSTENSK